MSLAELLEAQKNNGLVIAVMASPANSRYVRYHEAITQRLKTFNQFLGETMKSLLPALLLTATFVTPSLLPINAYANDDTQKTESSVAFTKGEDGVVAVHVQNKRFVPYLTLNEKGGHHYRLVTIATDVTLRGDQEQVDPNGSVSVTVDDMGEAKTPRVSFKDPGEDGVIVADRYFATTTPGCCGSADTHHVRLLETGQHLFKSTGPGSVGISAWATFPNARPYQIWWAAFGGFADPAQYAEGALGTLTYGNDSGPLSTFVVMRPQKPAEDDSLDLAIANGATLLWIDSKEKVPSDSGLANAGPSSGEPISPKNIWSLENVTDPAKVTGLVLALELGDQRLISIPVEGGKLIADKATIDPTLVLKPVP